MSNIPVDVIYSYGFTLSHDDLLNPSTIEAIQPFLDNQVEMALSSDGSLIFAEEEFEEIKKNADAENRKITLVDLRDYPSFGGAIYFYVDENFPLLHMGNIMDDETEGETALFSVQNTVLYLRNKKLKDAVDPTNEELNQLRLLADTFKFHEVFEWDNYAIEG